MEFFEELRKASIARDAEMTLGMDGQNPFTLSFRGNELAGETGDIDPEEFIKDIRKKFNKTSSERNLNIFFTEF